MTDTLIEKVAMAIEAEHDRDFVTQFDRIGKDASIALARAALTAIDEKYLIIERPKPGALTQVDVDRASDEIFRRAASIVEGTGTHVLVPVEPTQKMIGEGGLTRLRNEGSDPVAFIYAAMLAARPKVTP